MFRLAGTGIAVPRNIVSSETVDSLLDREPGWIEANYAIRQRHWANSEETSSALGAAAAREALAAAQWDSSELDVIIGSCGVMEQPIPGTAVLIQNRLGLGATGIPAFDVNATCLSFLLALQTVLHGFAMGTWRKALIVGADIASAALNFDDPHASVIFGDGAAAVALEANGVSELLHLSFATFSDHAALCQLQAGGTRLRPHNDLDHFLNNSRFQMDGPGVFKATARCFPKFINSLHMTAGISKSEVDLIIPHQASAAALEHLKRSLPAGHEKTIDIFRLFGNQIATSLPHALHHAVQTERIIKGQSTLFIGSSAGISLGGAIVRW